MVSVTKDGETNSSNYMPVRAVLEQMGYNVRWDGNTQTVSITTSDYDFMNPPSSTLTTPTALTTPLPTEATNEFYYKLAKEYFAELNMTLKNPSSLQIHAIYAGSVYNGPDMPDLEVVMIDCSAMNSMGGYTRKYLMAWYNKLGTISSDDEHYSPSEIKNRITLDINKIK